MHKLKLKFLIVAALFFLALPSSSRAEFNPNFIISDADLTDHMSMTLDSINNFLETKTGLLKHFVDGASKKTAAEIIFEYAWQEKISPKFLLVTLQKEQSLVEDSTPTQDQYNWATGWGVCDACSKSDPKIQKYKGFKNQVEYAAGGTRFYLDHPEKFSWKTGQTINIDGRKVTLTNDATRALYHYTPHLHGNENFHNIWQRWFGKIYPDGTLLQAQGEPGIWVIQHGIKRPFESMAALTSRYNPDMVIQVEKSVLNQYLTGTPIKFPNYSLIRSPRGTVCLIVDDTKRCIVSEEVLRQIGFNPEEFIDVNWGDFNDFIDGKPIASTESYSEGFLLQDNIMGGVWWIEDNTRHAIVDRAILDSKYPNNHITQSNPDDIAKYEKGSPVLFPNGTLIVGRARPTVYVIEHGKRRAIPTEEVFESYGYSWQKIVHTTDYAVEIHPLGETLNIGIN